jgi:hypothetical protein
VPDIAAPKWKRAKRTKVGKQAIFLALNFKCRSIFTKLEEQTFNWKLTGGHWLMI